MLSVYTKKKCVVKIVGLPRNTPLAIEITCLNPDYLGETCIIMEEKDPLEC